MLSRRDGDDFCDRPSRAVARARAREGGWRTHPPGVASHTSRMPEPDSAASAAIRYARYTHRAIEAIEATRWTTRVVSINPWLVHRAWCWCSATTLDA